jgi:aryl-alcohol dehydrogenase-like predicted oxidoreductase
MVEIGLGTWGLGGDSYGKIDEITSLKLLETAYDLGIRIFDTSPSYGDGLSEKILGKFIRGRGDIKIYTKVGMLPHKGLNIPQDFSSEGLRNSVDSSLKRLNLENVELVQLHSPQLTYLHKYPDVFSDLENLIQSGKVSKVGISLKEPSYLDEQIHDFKWKSFQFNYSLMDQRINLSDGIRLSSFRNAVRIARTPLHFGFLTTKGVSISQIGKSMHLSKWSKPQLNNWHESANSFRKYAGKVNLSLSELAIRFVRTTGIANVIIPGAMNLEQLHENHKYFLKGNLEDDQILEIKRVYNEIESRLVVKSPFNYSDLLKFE